MAFKLDSQAWPQVVADWLIVGMCEGAELTGRVAALNDALGGALVRLRERQDFSGKLGQLLVLPLASGLACERVLLVGLGPADKQSDATLHRAMMTAARHAATKKSQTVAVTVPDVGAADSSAPRRAQIIATAFVVGCMGQDLYRSEKKRHPFNSVTLLVDNASSAELLAAAESGGVLGEGINLVRELVNLPAQVMYPESFAERAELLAGEHGLACEVFDKARLEAERMNALLAVSSGSDRPPRVVVLEHNQAPKGAPVLALVGKGVTFDSGGLSIKTSEGMLTMKCDMAGAATVLGTMVTIARLKLPVHVIGLMGLTENMTGGSAMKLGDVLTSRAGVTIEVQNTDAEGRLVLSDVLDYAVGRGAERIVDLATLTGACVVALGEDVVGAMSNNEGWCDEVLGAAKSVGEDMWPLPMFDHYASLIESDVADIRNVGGRWGGAITAAKFLERFVKGKPWVHLDIAGPAYAGSDKPHRDGGGTGVMLRTLVELCRRLK